MLSGSQIIGETVYFSNDGGESFAEQYTLIYMYDESGAPIGFKYRTPSYTANTFDCVFYEKNLQGDIVALYNENGQQLCFYTYDAWGVATTSYTSAATSSSMWSVIVQNPFRYRGYYYDTETGWYYLQSRYYNPTWGRFLNADGYVSTGQGMLGYNMFAYCSNNPVMHTDPTGHFHRLIIAVAVLLFTPVGGTSLQMATSALSYAVMAVASIFDEDIRNDMNAIGWNPFNTDESATLNSSKVSFYKGVPVFRTSEGGRSGSFGAIFLTKDSVEDDLKHERGHNWQLMMMGIGTYGFTVGIPSPLKLGPWADNDQYYYAPWETMADILGGVTYRYDAQIPQQQKVNAWIYYAISTVCFPFTALYWVK